MATLPRPGLFGFLLLLAALAPAPSLAARGSSSDPAPLAAPGSVESRLSRISAALRDRGLAEAQEPGAQEPGAQEPGSAASAEGAPANAGQADSRLAWVFVNGPSSGFRNGGWGNGGFRNGGWGNGGFRNGSFRNFDNGAWRNGGGGAVWSNGGFRNHW